MNSLEGQVREVDLLGVVVVVVVAVVVVVVEQEGQLIGGTWYRVIWYIVVRVEHHYRPMTLYCIVI